MKHAHLPDEGAIHDASMLDPVSCMLRALTPAHIGEIGSFGVYVGHNRR